MDRHTTRTRRNEEIHVDAWSAGRRFTHDGTPAGLLSIARAAGLRAGAIVATHLPGPVVLRLTPDGMAPVGMDFESARRGGHPEVTAELVLDRIDPEFHPLVETGTVLVADFMSAGVPEALVARFAAGRERPGRIACCHRRSDGQVMVVLDIGRPEARDLRHEMIHAAQCLEDADAMEATLRAVAAGGEELRRRLLEAHLFDDDVRCLDWLADSCATARAEGSSEPFGTFDLALAIYPPKGIREIAGRLGSPSREATVASLFAAEAERQGLEIDPLSDLAREIVAYRFENGLEEGFAPMSDAIVRHLGRAASRHP